MPSPAADRVTPNLVSRIWRRDSSAFLSPGAPEAAHAGVRQRLGWLDAPTAMAAHLPEIDALATVLVNRTRRRSLPAVRDAERPGQAYGQRRTVRGLMVSLGVLTALILYLGTLVTGTGPHAGDENARAALKRLEVAWYELILADVGDPVVATAVQQMGDGLYHNASIGLLPDGSARRHTILEHLLTAVDRLSPRP